MIYHIEPVLEAFVWGGNKIIEAYHLQTDLPNVGQIYHVIALEGHQDCAVTEAGEPLSAFYRHHPEIFDCRAPLFPVRLATSCSEKRMSYHLHPGNEYAMAHEGTLGKVSGSIHIDPDGSVSTKLFGNRASSLEEFKRMVREEDWEHLFRSVEVRSGQYLHTPAGVIHGGGGEEEGGGRLSIVFATNSDISYRFFDYHRNDPNRKLHLQQVYDCVNIPEIEPLGATDPVVREENGLRITDYYAKPGEYVAKRLDVSGSGVFSFDRFFCLTCVRGKGTVDGVPVTMPETLLIPAHHGAVRLEGEMQLYMISYLDP